MLRMLILADDLSGAADCGVACVSAGLKTVVAFEDGADDVDAEVLSVDADTRRMTTDAAAHEVERLVRRYAPAKEVLFFKKIDSTLRGNISVELAAALDAHRSLHPRVGRTVAVMAPAFPAIGRTTVNGMQLVHGQPLHDAEIWRLQGMTGRSYIPDMLKSAGLKSALVHLDVIRSAGHALADAMRLSAENADVLVCDAETDTDLQAIAGASMELGRRAIWVGSAGLAYHLPHAAGFSTEAETAECVLPPLSGPLLFVIGSLSRNSIEQVRVLTSSSQALRLSVPPEVLLAGAESARWQEYEQELESAIMMNRDVVLGPGSEPQVELSERPLLAAALARMTSSISGRIGALIAAGGETARMVLQSWGVTGLRLIGELEKGIPVSTTEAWSRQLPVITKAGDFGASEALLNCWQFLHSTHRSLHRPRDTRKVTL
jgi:D-threonate/D-erythronate kinase